MKHSTPAQTVAATASLALGRSPYSKGAEKLAADLGAKPTATLVNTRMEVPSPRNGRPAYRWVDGCYVVRPDGTKEFPPVRIREAWSRCASEGWAFKVVSESEYKEQTVTTKHTPGPWKIEVDTVEGNRVYIHPEARNTAWLAEVNMTPPKEGTIMVGCGTKDPMANARLIAASPDLLEACRAALPVLIDEYGDPAPSHVQHTIDALRAAIAKASGK